MQIKTTADKVNAGIRAIQKKGTVTSKNNSGKVSVSGVEARFKFDPKDNILTVVIDDKPLFASMSYIESEIKKFFA